MNKIYYICKYTPVELIKAMGGEPILYNRMPEGFEHADGVIHSNVCGFGKALIEGIYEYDIKELVLVNCCDTIRSVYNVLKAQGKMDYLYFIDLPHSTDSCSLELEASYLEDFAYDYGKYIMYGKGENINKGAFGEKELNELFNRQIFMDSFRNPEPAGEDYIGVLGARMGDRLFDLAEESMSLPVKNLTCVNNRNPFMAEGESLSFKDLMAAYAQALLGQVPCMRMRDITGRRVLYEDPHLKGIIYHTVKFCDYYSFEFADLKTMDLPILKIESDYSLSAAGQLKTRLEAFDETFVEKKKSEKRMNGKTKGDGYFAGIDSGSTSTNVVVMNRDGEIITGIIVPTGAGARLSAEKALSQVLEKADLKEEQIDKAVATGYGRSVVSGDETITEITCHARGARYLCPDVRTVIDIGGQDSKVIRMDKDGNVVNFAMNDKCAAGTGRFIDMMARSLEMDLDTISERGLEYDEDITISSMCTVFAESEVVSLVARNKSIDDIVHGLNKAVASKIKALLTRVGGEAPYMMTGGVSKNKALVKTLEETLGASLIVDEKAQLCGAIGAALIAMDL
jgi:predicted CoA-substrate-specific enzyme activase